MADEPKPSAGERRMRVFMRALYALEAEDMEKALRLHVRQFQRLRVDNTLLRRFVEELAKLVKIEGCHCNEVRVLIAARAGSLLPLNGDAETPQA